MGLAGPLERLIIGWALLCTFDSIDSITRECFQFVVNPSDAGYFRLKHKDAKIFENHSNPVVLVFNEKLLLTTFR